MKNSVWIIGALLAVAIMGLVQIFSWEEGRHKKEYSVEEVVTDEALRVSELDVGALADITDNLEAACARNRFGLSEEECIETIRLRKDICMQQTAQKYPGQFSDENRMQVVVTNYVNCLFEK